MNPQEVDRAVYLAPGINPSERRELAMAAERVKSAIAQNVELRESVKTVALHMIEARRPPLAVPNFEIPAAEAARQNDHLRGVISGVDEVADYLTNVQRLNDLIIAIENKDKD